MPSFGRYKTVRELYRIGFVVLYSGRAEDSPEEKFAVKVFQPSALLLEKERAKAESDLFLSSALVQQKVSASGAQHWAPIFEQGLSPDGAFYVTNKYDHSLQQLIDGRVKLTAQALHAIIESAAKGLIELKQACSRPHGNLKAANVLITGAADFSQNKVVLTDPLPDEQIDTEVHWDTDLRAIAEFIYQFVMHRPSPVSSGWQAPKTEEWARLGKQADDWRNLCNRLLNASTRPGTMTIETFLEELAKLKVTKPIPTHRYIIAAGLIVAVGVIIWWSFFRKPPAPPQLKDWNKLCSEYINWVGDLHKALGLTPKDNILAKQWRDEKDIKLTEILDKIKKDASYPYSVVRDNGKNDVNDVKDIKTEEELVKLSVTDSDTEKALSAIENIKSFFDPNDGNAWPLLRRMNEDAKNYSGRGWQQPAAYLQDMVDAVKPGPGNKAIADNVGKLLKLDRQGETGNIRKYLDGIAKYQKAITDLDDGSVNKGAALGLGEAGEKSLSDLSKKLQEINEKAGERAGDIEVIDGLVREIERYRKDGQLSNPKEAAECARKLDDLRPDIEKIRSIKSIADEIKRLKPTLENLRDMALSLTEKPSKYFKRMEQEALSTAKSDKVIEKKRAKVIEALLQNYPLSKIEQYPELYSELRQKMNDADNNLIALGKELQTKLPPQIGIEMGEEDWQRRLGKIYEQEREKRINSIVEKIPPNAVPDINEAAFKETIVLSSTQFRQWRENLAEIVRDFNAIADGLELYYSLDDNLPQSQESISSLWRTWKDHGILKEQGIKDGLNELISRIEKLEKVKSYDRQNLIATAIDSRSGPEVIYAAWEKLGSLSEPNWPNQVKEWENDKKIQEKLKEQFVAIKERNQSRRDELLKMLDTASHEREIVFRKANIEQYREAIKDNSSQDQMLLRFDKFQPYGPDSDLSEIKNFEAIARKLAEFVTNGDWPSKFETKLLPDKPQTVVNIEMFEKWLKDVEDYRIIEDPRNDTPYTWNKTMEDVKTELDKEPTAEDSDKLRADFDKVKPDIEKMLKLPAIKMHGVEISKSKCEDYWKQLQEIRNKLKPEYCTYLQLKDGQVIFDPKAGIDSFEPVAKNDDDTFAPVKVTGWKEIEKIKTVFFRSTDKGDAGNMGWPKYIRSAKDPSVILAFVPAGRDNPEPFYMATHEITNAQYRRFLNGIGAENYGKSGRAKFGYSNNEILISCLVSDETKCAIKYKSKGDFVVDGPKDNAPVTWVYPIGANSYATKWIGGQLPTDAQFEYACRAGADTKYPWGTDLAQIKDYAHVRAAAWRDKVDAYNHKKDTDFLPCPIGAVDENTSLDINNIVCKDDGYDSAWPCATTKSTANKWGLHDMIGNVWEWCWSDEKKTQTVLCGGSCLAPLKYIAPDSNYPYEGPACDVGFRVILPAKSSP